VKNHPQKIDPREFLKNSELSSVPLSLNIMTELVNKTAINAPKKIPIILLNRKVLEYLFEIKRHDPHHIFIVITSKKVDFPAPFFPITPIIFPACA